MYLFFNLNNAKSFLVFQHCIQMIFCCCIRHMHVAVAYTSSCSIIDAAPVLTLMLLTLIHVLHEHATLCDMYVILCSPTHFIPSGCAMRWLCMISQYSIIISLHSTEEGNMCAYMYIVVHVIIMRWSYVMVEERWVKYIAFCRCRRQGCVRSSKYERTLCTRSRILSASKSVLKWYSYNRWNWVPRAIPPCPPTFIIPGNAVLPWFCDKLQVLLSAATRPGEIRRSTSILYIAFCCTHMHR